MQGFFSLISVCTIIVMHHLLLSFFDILFIHFYLLYPMFVVVSCIEISAVEVSHVHRLRTVLVISFDQNMFPRKMLWIALDMNMLTSVYLCRWCMHLICSYPSPVIHGIAFKAVVIKNEFSFIFLPCFIYVLFRCSQG